MEQIKIGKFISECRKKKGLTQKELAEKNISLDAGDEIEFTGRVFSTALGDAWLDVDGLKVITKKNPPKKEENVLE